jgi:hypothetical protein
MMRTKITGFENFISKIDNNCLLSTSQKFTLQWLIHSRYKPF